MSKLHTYTATAGDGTFLGTVTAGSTSEAQSMMKRMGLSDFTLKKS